MANKGLVFRNVAVPEDDHKLLAIIAEKEDRSMARQLAVMIREKYRVIQSEAGSMAEDMAEASEKK
jgi:hypothetical protein